MEAAWKSFRIAPEEGPWEPAGYNIRTPDGREYGRWRRVLRDHQHGLTVISHYRAPPGKAWKIIKVQPSNADAAARRQEGASERALEPRLRRVATQDRSRHFSPERPQKPRKPPRLLSPAAPDQVLKAIRPTVRHLGVRAPA
jgi:hypothetical protein